MFRNVRILLIVNTNMRTLNVTSAMMRGKFILNRRLGKNLRNLVLALAKCYVIFCTKFRFIESKLTAVMGKNKYPLSIFTDKEKTKTNTPQSNFEMNLIMKRFLRIVLTARSF